MGWATCEGEVLVQGDEGPVRGVAQVVDCHGVTVGHEEKGGRSRETARGRERWRENTQGTRRMSMDGMTMEDKCERLEPCGVMNEFRRLNYGPRAVCSMLHFVQVFVRRVIHVVVHNGLTDVEGVLVVVHTLT